MADRTAASLFASIFGLLAEGVTDPKATARDMASMAREYDFTPRQMYADKALGKLDLVRKGIDPDDPEEGEVQRYWCDDGFDKARPLTPEEIEKL
jgi:hypothetical protein